MSGPWPTLVTASNVAPLWCAKVCDHTQKPYIWTQAIRLKISAENNCKWEPMVWTRALAARWNLERQLQRRRMLCRSFE